jgi:outer membrane protein assembly factor BamA
MNTVLARRRALSARPAGGAMAKSAMLYLSALLLAASANGATPPPEAAKAAPTKPAAAKKSRGEPVYHLLGFNLTGSKHIDGDALVATLPQHAGDIITADEITADADIIRAKLKALHVHGDMTTATLEREGKGHWIWVVWDIQKMDALSHAPLFPPRHFATQTFAGNVKLSNDQLAAATGLHPGDKMPDGSVSDARTGIEQAYDKVFPGATVEVKGKVILKDAKVTIDWRIVEPR